VNEGLEPLFVKKKTFSKSGMMAVRAFCIAVGTPSPPNQNYGNRWLFNMSTSLFLAAFIRIAPFGKL